MFSQSTTIIVDKFPSALRTKLTSNVEDVTSKDNNNGYMENARIRKDCPKCAATEMTWSEAQLRSVDEGTTIFFRCPDCGHRYDLIYLIIPYSFFFLFFLASFHFLRGVVVVNQKLKKLLCVLGSEKIIN